MSRWTLKISRAHMNGKTGKEDWKKSAIETIRPSEETVFKIFYRVSSGLTQSPSSFFLGEPMPGHPTAVLTWWFALVSYVQPHL